MKVVIGGVLAVACATARADDTPPPVMRDVPAATDATVAVSFGTTGGAPGYSLADLELRGRVRIASFAEVFASTGAGDFQRHDDEGRGYDRSFVTNTSVGARGVVRAWDAVALSLAGSLWLPTATHGFPNAEPDAFATKEGVASLRGMRDPYAFADGGAAGVGADLRVNVAPTWYVQAEATAVFLRAAGAARLDDVTLAAGAGMTSTRGVQVAAELRVVQEPSDEAFGFAVAVGWPERMPHPRLVMSAGLSAVRGSLCVGGEVRFP